MTLSENTRKFLNYPFCSGSQAHEIESLKFNHRSSQPVLASAKKSSRRLMVHQISSWRKLTQVFSGEHELQPSTLHLLHQIKKVLLIESPDNVHQGVPQFASSSVNHCIEGPSVNRHRRLRGSIRLFAPGTKPRPGTTIWPSCLYGGQVRRGKGGYKTRPRPILVQRITYVPR